MNRTLYLAVCCLCGLLAATVYHFRDQLELPLPFRSTSDQASKSANGRAEFATERAPIEAIFSFSEGIEKASPSVVSVYTLKALYQTEQDNNAEAGNLPAADARAGQTNQGSGVVIDSQGLIVTSYHLVAGADVIYIALADDRLLQATLLGSDIETDLALVQIQPTNDLQPLNLVADDSPRVGDVVLAIGNPYGVGKTVTQGIVSAVRRKLNGVSALQNFLQIDAAINPGNSGGALVDPHGRLVGINTAVYSRVNGAQGIGFAIPVSLVRRVVPQLLNHGRVIRGWLGAGVDDLLNYPDLFANSATGVVVVAVVENGPAHNAGLRRGDILLGIDSKPVRRAASLLTDVAASAPGTDVVLSIERDRQQINLNVTLAERPSPGN